MPELLEALLEPRVLPLLTFLLGAVVGHRLAVWRDRRKEFNEVCDRVRLVLLGQRRRPTTVHWQPDAGDLDRLDQMLPWWRRKRWHAAWQRHEQAREQAYQVDAMGQGGYVDVTAIGSAIDKCLALLRRL